MLDGLVNIVNEWVKTYRGPIHIAYTSQNNVGLSQA